MSFNDSDVISFYTLAKISLGQNTIILKDNSLTLDALITFQYDSLDDYPTSTQEPQDTPIIK